jgi:hypothetical protein
MTNRHLIGSVALLALLTLATAGPRAEGDGNIPTGAGSGFAPAASSSTRRSRSAAASRRRSRPNIGPSSRRALLMLQPAATG